MNHNTILLIIDPQNDFCDSKGALYVPNAEKDIQNIIDLLDKHGDKIDEVILTADDHIPYDIAHPAFWVDKDGEHPAPFTTITLKDIQEGNYTTIAEDQAAGRVDHRVADVILCFQAAGARDIALVHSVCPSLDGR